MIKLLYEDNIILWNFQVNFYLRIKMIKLLNKDSVILSIFQDNFCLKIKMIKLLCKDSVIIRDYYIVVMNDMYFCQAFNISHRMNYDIEHDQETKMLIKS